MPTSDKTLVPVLVGQEPGGLLVEALITWLDKRGRPDSGIHYQSDGPRGQPYVSLHGTDATFVADHFHGKGARNLAAALREVPQIWEKPDMRDPEPGESLDTWWKNIPYRGQWVVPGVLARLIERATREAAFSAPSGAEQYCVGLLVEESGEILQHAGKAERFGMDTPGKLDAKGMVSGETPRTLMPDELGDMLAAIEFSLMHGVFDRTAVEQARQRKLSKLLNPDSRDNLGRPLAPLPNPP